MKVHLCSLPFLRALTGASFISALIIPRWFRSLLFILLTHVADLNSTVSMEMIWVEPGTFMMGSPESEAGRSTSETQHEVTLTMDFT